MIAGRLTMRALIERNQATGTDAWNNPVAPDFQPVGDPLPCFVWSDQARELVDDGKSALLEDMRALFALGADVRPDDEISSVTNRRGVEIIRGRLKVEGDVQYKHTHLEAALRRIG